MDTGSYKVVFTDPGGRHLVTSEGTVSGRTETASAELEDLTPSALYYVASAGNDVKIYSFVAAANIVGDLHGNHDVQLMSGPLISWLIVTGDVSACNDVILGNRHNESDYLDAHVAINGDTGEDATVEENAQVVFFPVFNTDAYILAAQEGGDYYTTDQIYTDQTLSPTSGCIVIKGSATFNGNCTLNGGIIAKKIFVNGTLTQVKSGLRNIIYAYKKDIQVSGRLAVEEAIIFAARDIAVTEALADLEINGIMMAGRDLLLWNFLCYIDYNHIETHPLDMGEEEEGRSFAVISWNQ